MKGGIVAVIPARAQSKGVPNKNIRELSGHPILAYSIMAARNSQYIERVIVSTDSQEYIDIATYYGAQAPFLRPAELASDKATDADVMLHLLNWYKSGNNDMPEYFVHLRPTTPLREAKVIDMAICNMVKNKNICTALRSVHEMAETAYKSFEIDGAYLKTVAKDFEIDAVNDARQVFPKTYQANGYVDVLKADYILENKIIHGDKVMPYLTNYTVEIDTEDDLEYLQYSISKQPQLFKQLFGS